MLVDDEEVLSRKNDIGDPMPMRSQTSHHIQLLDAIADDYDIEWKPDPFEM